MAKATMLKVMEKLARAKAIREMVIKEEKALRVMLRIRAKTNQMERNSLAYNLHSASRARKETIARFLMSRTACIRLLPRIQLG